MKLSKTSIIAAACLGALALTGVGFAGWYIVSDTKEEKSGNITIYQITNNAVSIDNQKWVNKAEDDDAEITGNDINVIFGSPKTPDANQSSWFEYTTEESNKVEAECFPVFKFNLTDYSGETPKVDAKIKITGDSSGNTISDNADSLKHYYDCVHGYGTDNKKYITGPDLVTKNSDTGTGSDTYSINENATIEVKLSETATTSTNGFKVYKNVTVDLGFGWGDFFKDSNGGDGKAMNPYTYFGKQAKTDENVKNAIDAMKAISKISGFKYQVTITITSGGSNS